MNDYQKRDVSMSMAKATPLGTLISIPVAIAQVAGFHAFHGVAGFEPKWNAPSLIALILAGVIFHEIIHGVSWAMFGNKPLSEIKFGFMWKTITPYAHFKEPLEIGVCRLGAFIPGLFLGIIPYNLALFTGSGDLMWFSLLHTTAASGDWLILWIIRTVKPGYMVADHPSNAGCFVLEPV
jgi:hypothetical protein